MSITVSPPAEAQEQRVASRRGMPTWEIAYLDPRQGEWTEEEYLNLDTRRLIEFSDGCLEFLPMPTLSHNYILYILEFLFDQLRDHLRRSKTPGRAHFSGVPVRLREGKYREPDVFYLRPERLKQNPKYPDGADLTMEIVSGSPEDRKRDLETNRQEYAAAGIPEYWIVDPEQRRSRSWRSTESSTAFTANSARDRPPRPCSSTDLRCPSTRRSPPGRTSKEQARSNPE